MDFDMHYKLCLLVIILNLVVDKLIYDAFDLRPLENNMHGGRSCVIF
jgi:hypothetical protein